MIIHESVNDLDIDLFTKFIRFSREKISMPGHTLYYMKYQNFYCRFWNLNSNAGGNESRKATQERILKIAESSMPRLPPVDFKHLEVISFPYGKYAANCLILDAPYLFTYNPKDVHIIEWKHNAWQEA